MKPCPMDICAIIYTLSGESGITVSLCTALQRLRWSTKCALLWIDAVCKNQNDKNEKSHQVRLMSKLYNRLAQVIVCLGEEAEGSGLLSTWVHKVADISYQELVRIWEESPESRSEFFAEDFYVTARSERETLPHVGHICSL
jgi:Heterokaryon incompatibility protein (HET)